MNKLIFGASLAALALATPAIVQAQDTALEQRRTQLATPLQTEANAIDTALRALPQGTQPDAAMQQRV
ncbi:MAG: hypothetical protein ACXWU1_05345, partial [Allosphingosinicella sp.]